MADVNLDALIGREDFEVEGSQELEATISTGVKINELQGDAFFYGALRKPDFQRETSEWEPKRVTQLIKTFVSGDLIPSVILWKNKDLVFVVDGSHRLSALIAWVQDDYGDGARSMAFFDNEIPDDQRAVAQQTRELVEKEIGSYSSHLEAVKSPEQHSPEKVKRARKMGSISIPLQWVQGDSAKAEASFVRINQQAAKITDEELELIQNRKLPNTIAARAVLRRATGHQYWSAFGPEAQKQIKDISTDLHNMMFTPQATSGQRASDLSAGGSVYAGTALRMIYDFVNLCVETPTDEADKQGEKTIEYLRRSRRVMQQLLSSHPSSLGLYPAIYFYSWTSKQQPIYFLAVAAFVIDLERKRKLIEFSGVRNNFEEYLIENRSLLTQVIRHTGSSARRLDHMKQYLDDVLSLLVSGVPKDGIAKKLEQGEYSYFVTEKKTSEGAGQFSKGVKAGTVMREIIKQAPRCGICGSAVPMQAVSIDHKTNLREGGSAAAENAQVTHPFCNSGAKGKLHK